MKSNFLIACKFFETKYINRGIEQRFQHNILFLLLLLNLSTFYLNNNNNNKEEAYYPLCDYENMLSISLKCLNQNINEWEQTFCYNIIDFDRISFQAFEIYLYTYTKIWKYIFI